MKEKTIEELERELSELRNLHVSQWDTYGSELCAGDMIRQEEKLEKEIAKLKERELLKKRTINRWEKSGLLTGLTPMKDKPWLFEPNKIFTREHVIDILNQYAFFLSDNGDLDTSGKEWLDMCYPYPEEKNIPAK